jgi:hypothetical protein
LGASPRRLNSKAAKAFFFGKAKAKANLPATENLETVSDIRQV